MLSPENLRDIFLGAIGGSVACLLEYSKHKKNAKDGEIVKFSFSLLFINIVLGVFVGYLVGTLLESKTYGRDVIVALSGVVAYNILILAESKFAVWLFDRFNKRG